MKNSKSINIAPKKIIIFITHSLGELDVIFPLLSAVKNKYKVDIEIIFCVEELYRDFCDSVFYKYCSENLNILVSFILLPNKIDSKFRRLNFNIFSRKIAKLYFKFFLISKSYQVLKKIISADIIMHEYSNVFIATEPIYWVNRWLGTKIFTYHHGHSIDIDTVASRKIKNSNRVTFLNFHEHSNSFVMDLGFNDQFIIGYPKFFNIWLGMVSDYSGTKRKHVIIYTRGIHQFYMDKDKYKFLLESSYKVIRETLGNIDIIIKPHPREGHDVINKIINRISGKNIYISTEHAAVLASNAILAISFWTSAILDSLSFGVPSVEYYIEADRFREIEPNGSSYRKLGIDSVSNQNDLKFFINDLVSGGYKTPVIVKELSKKKDVSFIELA